MPNQQQLQQQQMMMQQRMQMANNMGMMRPGQMDPNMGPGGPGGPGGPNGPNGPMMGPHHMRPQMNPQMMMQMQQQQTQQQQQHPMQMQNRPPPPEYGKLMPHQVYNLHERFSFTYRVSDIEMLFLRWLLY